MLARRLARRGCCRESMVNLRLAPAISERRVPSSAMRWGNRNAAVGLSKPDPRLALAGRNGGRTQAERDRRDHAHLASGCGQNRLGRTLGRIEPQER